MLLKEHGRLYTCEIHPDRTAKGVFAHFKSPTGNDVNLKSSPHTFDALSGCIPDPGYETLKKAEKKYEHVTTQGLSAENAKNADLFATELKVIALAHGKAKSGKEAAIQLSELRAKAAARQKAIREEFAKLSAQNSPMVVELVNYQFLAVPIAKKAHGSSYGTFGKPVKVGECLAFNRENEFANDLDQALGLEVFKVAKLGKDQAMLEAVLTVDKSDMQNPSKKLKSYDQPAEEKIEYANLIADRLRVDCKQAEKMKSTYKSFLKHAVTLKPIYAEMGHLTKIESESLF